ncbi:MAG: endonuclease/exonuclease/phosphatase family protein, partial [Deltaproteobacteria bacterium]|nr:endonuclease/exonuclease/phosphatase family protein [Deltaproteobacteria bacterium]MBW2537738.1 endonuclease/exonuclease/phosphatase family protein [Deltaproteobacteria bacterium]
LCSFCGAGEPYDPWGERLEHFRDLLERHDPDLVGLQELAFESEVDQVLALRPGYEAVYYREEESGFAYPDATLLFRSSRFEQLDAGAYWLSPTPEVPSSRGFSDDQVAPRLVVWAELKDRASRRRLYAATTHFDNNPPCQERSAPLVLERTGLREASTPAVVVGDFNSQPADEAFRILTEGDGSGTPLTDSQSIAAEWSVDTNQQPVPDYDLAQRIDHIFVAPAAPTWAVESWAVDLHVYGTLDRYPSDHRAMVAVMRAPELD